MEVKETSLVIEDDSRGKSAFLICNVQKACLSDQVQFRGRQRSSNTTAVMLQLAEQQSKRLLCFGQVSRQRVFEIIQFSVTGNC